MFLGKGRMERRGGRMCLGKGREEMEDGREEGGDKYGKRKGNLFGNIQETKHFVNGKYVKNVLEEMKRNMRKRGKKEMGG